MKSGEAHSPHSGKKLKAPDAERLRADLEAYMTRRGLRSTEQRRVIIDTFFGTAEQMQTSDESIYALGDVAELPNGKLYAFILPIRNQALWLAEFLSGQKQGDWTPPVFTTKAKVHGFEAVHPYNV